MPNPRYSQAYMSNPSGKDHFQKLYYLKAPKSCLCISEELNSNFFDPSKLF